MLRRPSFHRRQSLQICIEFLRRILRHMGGEHRIGISRGEATAGIGRTGLHQYRPALWTPRRGGFF